MDGNDERAHMHADPSSLVERLYYILVIFSVAAVATAADRIPRIPKYLYGNKN